MVFRPTEISEDVDKAKMGFIRAARSLGVKFNCQLQTMWCVELYDEERTTFLELAREAMSG
jgi:hypothetical protein